MRWVSSKEHEARFEHLPKPHRLPANPAKLLLALDQLPIEPPPRPCTVLCRPSSRSWTLKIADSSWACDGQGMPVPVVLLILILSCVPLALMLWWFVRDG